MNKSTVFSYFNRVKMPCFSLSSVPTFMKKMRNIQPIVGGHYYHIYNRGISGQKIFLEKKNYSFFLEKFKEYTSKVANILAYTLLEDHFHALVYVKEDKHNEVKGSCLQVPNHPDFCRQMTHFFTIYVQSFNKQYQRKGSLFVSPFRRKLIESDLYLGSVMFYIHANAEHHGYIDDFRDWPYSSYGQIVDGQSELIDTAWIYEWFGSRGNFIKFHTSNQKLMTERKWVIEPK